MLPASRHLESREQSLFGTVRDEDWRAMVYPICLIRYTKYALNCSLCLDSRSQQSLGSEWLRIKTRRKTLLLYMRIYALKAGINSGGEGGGLCWESNNAYFVISACNNDWDFSAEWDRF
jgi:hypothetical protein